MQLGKAHTRSLTRATCRLGTQPTATRASTAWCGSVASFLGSLSCVDTPQGALQVTFGVGELSAINAVAGAFAEYIPVVVLSSAASSTAVTDGSFIS